MDGREATSTSPILLLPGAIDAISTSPMLLLPAGIVGSETTSISPILLFPAGSAPVIPTFHKPDCVTPTVPVIPIFHVPLWLTGTALWSDAITTGVDDAETF